MPQNDDSKLSAADQVFASTLAGLTPQPARIDRDALLFEAGRVAGRRAAMPWRVLTVLLMGTVLGTALWPRQADIPPSGGELEQLTRLISEYR